MADWNKISEAISGAASTMQNLSGAAGSAGSVIGSAVQGYKEGKSGNVKPIEVDVEGGESWKEIVLILGVAAAVVVILSKI